MTPINYNPPPEKFVTSIALDKDVREWLMKELPKYKRSHFINYLVRAEMIRTQEAKRRGKKVRQYSHDAPQAA